MTPRKFTSGFDFWSRAYLHMVVMHLRVKFGANTFIQSGVIDIFQKIKDGARRHLGFFENPQKYPLRLIRGAYPL